MDDPGFTKTWPWCRAAPVPPWEQLYPWLGLILDEARVRQEDFKEYDDHLMTAELFVDQLISDLKDLPLPLPPAKEPPFMEEVDNFFWRLWDALDDELSCVSRG